MRLDVKRKLTARSDRVKCVDLHPVEPWMLASLYNGNIHIWNHENQQLVKSFEVSLTFIQSGNDFLKKYSNGYSGVSNSVGGLNSMGGSPKFSKSNSMGGQHF